MSKHAFCAVLFCFQQASHFPALFSTTFHWYLFVILKYLLSVGVLYLFLKASLSLCLIYHVSLPSNTMLQMYTFIIVWWPFLRFLVSVGGKKYLLKLKISKRATLSLCLICHISLPNNTILQMNTFINRFVARFEFFTFTGCYFYS